MNETIEQQERDAEMIFNQITNGDFKNNTEATQALVALYIPDMTISRSGISLAMKKLENHYSEKED
jgi:hypothetical protein